MSIQACADIVAKGDPQRFRAAMAAPVSARRILFPLYALAVEVARAPWVTQEAMIAEMRLQWWRDVLTEIQDGAPVRRHEVASPLAEVLDSQGATDLGALVEARRWDIYRNPFEDTAAHHAYLEDTAAPLVWTAARLLGAPAAQEQALRQIARATALARFLEAVPALEAAGHRPLVDGRPHAVAALAQLGLAWLADGRHGLRGAPRPIRAATIEAWRTAPLLAQAARDPGRVASGTLALGPLRDHWRLRRATKGRL